MISEAELRERFPEIEWDSPVLVTIPERDLVLFCCRICIAQRGIKAAEIVNGTQPRGVFFFRQEAEAHIEGAHSGP